MARTATRTASVFTRVDPETKEQAEMILNQLGIPIWCDSRIKVGHSGVMTVTEETYLTSRQEAPA